MDRTKKRPRVAAALLTILLVTAGAAPARADLWSGACALRLTLSFHSPVRPPVSAPAYELEATGAADLDLTTPGIQSCAHTLSGSAFGGTAAGGAGSAAAWSCGTTLGSGSWDQSFDEEGPQGFSGSHLLTGSWGSWTLQIRSQSLNVIGVGDFSLQAAEATKTPSCATGSLQSVTMVGVLVFQDP
ncbi:MAG TPA: hypothetical protein VEU29_01820 [Actinomycetota bacterium]|nr:hypothetical protein [Actinomycetota bacterium]